VLHSLTCDEMYVKSTRLNWNRMFQRQAVHFHGLIRKCNKTPSCNRI
jgi:hypothetical protein